MVDQGFSARGHLVGGMLELHRCPSALLALQTGQFVGAALGDGDADADAVVLRCCNARRSTLDAAMLPCPAVTDARTRSLRVSTTAAVFPTGDGAYPV
jgi:hypothetical protein